MALPLTLEHTITLGSNLVVKGRPGEDRDNNLEIHFLHGWKTVDKISKFIYFIIFIIMYLTVGEPILFVLLRQHLFLNVWTYKVGVI